MIVKFLPVLFFILICQNTIKLFAQSSLLPINQVAVNGLVKDAKTGIPILGATVSLFKEEIELRKSTTDDKGNFAFINMSEGSYRIEVAFISLLSNAGTNVVEILNNTPGIEMIDNSISMRGKSGISVYIDGRQAHFAGKDLI